MTPIFDGKAAVRIWRSFGGYLCYGSGWVWWHRSVEGRYREFIFNRDSTRTAIMAAGYTEQEADEMIEGRKWSNQ